MRAALRVSLIVGAVDVAVEAVRGYFRGPDMVDGVAVTGIVHAAVGITTLLLMGGVTVFAVYIVLKRAPQRLVSYGTGLLIAAVYEAYLFASARFPATISIGADGKVSAGWLPIRLVLEVLVVPAVIALVVVQVAKITGHRDA